MYQPMYGQGYPLQYYPPGYPLQYYPPLAATTAYYPAMQPAPVRPTIMVPVSIDIYIYVCIGFFSYDFSLLYVNYFQKCIYLIMFNCHF